MKCPTLVAALTRDLDAGHAAIVQIVSTNQALLERRLAEIPSSEWGDLSIDITPREDVLDYLKHSRPQPAAAARQCARAWVTARARLVVNEQSRRGAGAGGEPAARHPIGAPAR